MRFSVIVPLYNKADYVERTLASVFAQHFEDYEVIVVDDGSTDNSYEVASTAAQGHAQCRIVRQDNAGVAAARNRGVQLAGGDYVCFLDSDDWWDTDFLVEIQRLIALCPDAGLYATSYYLVKNGKPRVAPIGVESNFKEGYINYCQTYARRLCMPVTSSSVAIPREVFQESGGFRTGIALGEDFDLWIRIALKHGVALVNRPLAYYFQDIPTGGRATRRIHAPASHMLWNLDYLADEEARNPDYKLLIDRLRADGLWRHYLSRQYHAEAVAQLQRIDWSHVPQSTYRLYHSPLWWQRLRFAVRTRAAIVKSIILKSIKHS